MNSAQREFQPSPDTIGGILRRCGLESPSHLIENVVRYYVLLQKWNRRINLTSINNPTEVITSHFAESFFAAHHLKLSDAPVLDIGSGAGFPGLAMKLYRPEVVFYLLEPRKKRAAFLSAVRRELGLPGIFVLNKSVEECRTTDFTEQPGMLTLRALGEAGALIRCGLRFARPGARAMLFLTSANVDQVLSQLPQITWNEPIPIPWSDQRLIVVGEANGNCST